MDLKLTQREAAEGLGVDKTTVQFWENSRVKPSLAKMPKIIEFLGCDPFKKETENLRDIRRQYRRIKGLSRKKLAS